MVKYGELDRMISVYIRAEALQNIPVEYFRQVIRIAIRMNNEGRHWDMQQAAAVLLYFAFHDGHLHPSQLTMDGLQALDHAEKLLQDNTLKAVADEMHTDSAAIGKIAG